MAKSTRQTIIDQLKIDIENNLSTTNGYSIDMVEVVNAVVDFDYFANRPAIGYVELIDEIETEYLGGESRSRWVYIYIYCYSDENVDDNSQIDLITRDIQKFVYSSDWTYYENTLLEEGLEVEIPGTDNNRSMGEVIIKVQYEENL